MLCSGSIIVAFPGRVAVNYYNDIAWLIAYIANSIYKCILLIMPWKK